MESVVPIQKKEIKDVKIIKKFSDNLYAPMNKEQSLGSIEFKINDEKLGEIEIVSDDEIKSLNFKDYFFRLFKFFFNIEKYFYL